jgi:hypothetical protein
MTVDDFQETITALIERKPFQRFTVELNTGPVAQWSMISSPHAPRGLFFTGSRMLPGPSDSAQKTDTVDDLGKRI